MRLLALLATTPLLVAAPDGDEILTRIKTSVAGYLSRQPNYTCGQTITRFQRAQAKGKFELVDRVRLEVALIDGAEMFSWPGAERIDGDDLTRIVSSGSISSGSFALHARTVFGSEGTSFRFAGEEELDGVECVRFDYDVPWEYSQYLLRTPQESAVVGLRGSFWADRETARLVRLEVHADKIPPKLGLDSAVEVMDYALVKIGAGFSLLPRASIYSAAGLEGFAVRNETQYSGCRQYAGKSTISFGEAPSAPAAEPVPAPPTRVIELPGKLRIELNLETPIDSETCMVGDEIRALVRSEIRRSGGVLLEKGAVASGRIIHFRKIPGLRPRYILALRLDKITSGSGRGKLTATLEKLMFPLGPAVRVSSNRFDRKVRIPETDPLYDIPGAGVLRIESKRGGFVIPRGAVTIWRTSR